MTKKRMTASDAELALESTGLYIRYKLLAESLFKWSGLPEGIEERHIEEYLFNYGQALFFRDPKMAFMCLQAQNGTNLNVYADPLTYRAIGINYNKEYRAGHNPDYAVFAAANKNALQEGIVIRNNAHSVPTKTLIMPFLLKLQKIEQVMDINLETNKLPFIIECTPANEFSMKNVMNKLFNGVYAIFTTKKLDVSKSVQVIQTGAEFRGNEMIDYKHAVEADLMTVLGIDNVNVSKRERLISGEATANDKLINSFIDLSLTSRKAACDAINATFGLNVSVAYRNPVENENVDNNVEMEDNTDEIDN